MSKKIEYDYLANAAAPGECTGLIPRAPQTADELESYEDVYHYEPPKPPKNISEN